MQPSNSKLVPFRGGAFERTAGSHPLAAAGQRRRWATGTQLQVFEEAVVGSVRANPEPDDLNVVQKPKGTVSQANASGVDRIAMVNLLELKAWTSLISGGSSRYAAQKRGVARDFTACRGRVP